MNEQNRPPEKIKIDPQFLEKQTVNIPVSGVHTNVAQELIVITEDKVHLCLSKYLKRIRKGSWIAPLCILITIVGTLVTSSFKDTLSLSANTWLAFFIFGGLLCFVWLVCSIIQTLKSKKEEDIIEDIVAELKRGVKTF